MGLFLCRVCNQQLSLEPPHVCKPEDIVAYVRETEDRANTAERRLEEIRNAVFQTMQGLASLEDETVTVETEWLRKLWQSAQCQWYDSKTADSFLVRWIAMHTLLSRAFDLFRSKKCGRNETRLEKLKALKEACEHAKKMLGYENSKLDVEPEDWF